MMLRSIAFLFFLVAPCGVFSQIVRPSYNSFHIDSKEVIWLRDFDQPGISSAKLRELMMSHLTKNDAVQNLTLDESGALLASIEGMKIDYKKLGVPYLYTSNKISHGRWKGKIKIDFSDEKYRITIYDLGYTVRMDKVMVTRAQMGACRKFERGTLSNSFLNKEKTFFKKPCLKDLDLLNITFVDQFRLIPQSIWNPDNMIQSSSF